MNRGEIGNAGVDISFFQQHRAASAATRWSPSATMSGLMQPR
jgi:hypothetical protein